MGLSFALASLAAATAATPAHVPTKAVTSATATARILSGARVNLGDAEGRAAFELSRATITVEDGSKRSARLVEFQ